MCDLSVLHVSKAEACGRVHTHWMNHSALLRIFFFEGVANPVHPRHGTRSSATVSGGATLGIRSSIRKRRMRPQSLTASLRTPLL
jgi:hypothetical protein